MEVQASLASSTRGCCCINSIFSTREFLGMTTRSSSSSTDTLRSIFLKAMTKRTVDRRVCIICKPRHSRPETHPLRQRNSSLKNATKKTKIPPRPFLVVVVVWFISGEACNGIAAAVDIIYSLSFLKRLLMETMEEKSKMKYPLPLLLEPHPCSEFKVR